MPHMKPALRLPLCIIATWIAAAALSAAADAQAQLPASLQQLRQQPLPPGAILIIPTGHPRSAPQTQPSAPENTAPNSSAIANASSGGGPTIYYPAGYYPYVYYYPGYTEGPEGGPLIYWPVGLAPVCGCGSFGGGFGNLFCGDNWGWLQTCLPNSFRFARGGGFVSAGSNFIGGPHLAQGFQGGTFQGGAFQGSQRSFHAFSSTTELGRFRTSGGSGSRSFSAAHSSMPHGQSRSAPAHSATRRH